MALIECSECKRQVSTLAASCPGCGAPVASNQLSDEHQINGAECKFCMSRFSEEATVCPSCHAKLGYFDIFWPINIGVVGKTGAYVFIGALAVASISPMFPIAIPLLLYAFYRFRKGPSWYQSKIPGN